ncbi:MAG TPA: hypothetical protein VNA12_06460 [Mycobacteriales bacterium]|nr:hypothetical protein [Mycobacteriales bacterium]
MFRDRVLTTAALVLLLAGCSESGGDPESPSPSPAASTPSAASSAPAEDVRVIQVAVSGGKVTREARRVDVARGDAVRIEVTSDVADEVHLHTYDIRAAVGPGGPATLAFTATIPGQFEVELEQSHLLLVVIAVR